MGKYDYLFEDQNKPSAAVNLMTGVEAQPDAAAEELRLAKRYGLPPQAIKFYRSEYVNRAKVDDAMSAMESSPALTKWLSADPLRAEVSHDDVGVLSKIGQTVSSFGRYAVGASKDGQSSLIGDLPIIATKGVISGAQGIVGLANIPTFGYAGKALESLGVDFKGAQETLSAGYSPFMRASLGEVTDAKGFGDTLSAVAQNPAALTAFVGESVPGMVAGGGLGQGLLKYGSRGVAAGAAGPALPGLLSRKFGERAAIYAGAAGEGAITAGSMTEEIRKPGEGLSVGQVAASIAAGIGTGGLSVLGGRIAQKLGIADIDTALAAGTLSQPEIKKGLVRQLAEAGLSEGVLEEMPQSAQEQVWQNIAMDRPVMEGVANAAAIGLMTGAVAGSAFQGLQYLSQKNNDRAQLTEQQTQMLTAVNALSAASRLRERAPDSFEQFIAEATQDGPAETLYINAQVLNQSGLGETLAQALPSVAEQLQVAMATGADIQIPTAEFAARVAGTDVGAQLLDHLKIDPNGFSRAEAQDYLENQSETLRTEVERALTLQEQDATFKAGIDAVREDIRQQIAATRRFTEPVSKAYADMHAAYFGVTAAKLGMSPQELAARYPLRIVSERVDGQMQFDQQGSPSATITGTEIAPAEVDIKTLRDAARQWYEANLKGKTVVNEGSGKGVTFESGKKAFSTSANPEKLRLFAALGDLVQNGKFGEPIPPKDPSRESNVKAYYWLEGQVAIGGRVVRAGVMVREDNRGHLYYNHNPVETKASDLPDSGALRKAGAGTNKGEAFDQSVLPSDDGINMRLSQGQQSPRGQIAFGSDITQTPSVISLLKGADLSTFLHESGHFFLEMQFDLAMRLRNEPELNDLQKQFLADQQKVLEWFGIGSLEEWYAMPPEERRGFHERYARGFEAYLFEGKAPSIELESTFRQFRSWLVNVYRQLLDAAKRSLGKVSDAKAIGTALDVELTDEVRGVMDRMLATTEQIQLAEQGRSMIALFNSPEQAGMTVEEFAAYQALGLDSTTQAIEELQGKALRDMQWARNARGRWIKRLQAEAKDLRKQMRIEARAQILSEPLYKAWQFLTLKQPAEDVVKDPQAPKDNPDVVDPTRDSLFVAIAKLGGINKAQVIAQWGTDPKDKPQSGIFAKPVWRTGKDGMSIDRAVESLAELGYLEQDEFGKADVRQLEEMFADELRGNPGYSVFYDVGANREMQPGEQVANPSALTTGKLHLGSVLNDTNLSNEGVQRLKDFKMTLKDGGLSADMVGDMFGYSSGDELVQALASAVPLKEAIEDLTDKLMLEQNGELATPEAIERAADAAVMNDLRARMVASEANALSKAALGEREQVGTDKNGRPVTRAIVPQAAKAFAQQMIARLKIRNIKPGMYANAQSRAAREAQKAQRSGDLMTAAAEKRNELIQIYAARAAYDAQDEVRRGVEYLKKFANDDIRKRVDPDYVDQIQQLLERFELRKVSNKELDKRASLAKWLESQREQGFEPDVPADLVEKTQQTNFRNLSLEEFRGLVETVKQIEHLGKLKSKLLTAKDQRDFEAARDEIAASITANADGRQVDSRTATTPLGMAVQSLKKFWHSHFKAATLARVMDGGKDGGAMWEYFIRTANDRANMESTMNAEATEAISKILAPVFALGSMNKKTFYPTIGRSLTRQERLAVALNTGNAGNLQRLLDGEGWTMDMLAPVLMQMPDAELNAVQQIWSYLETYRPLVGEKERRVYGKEPNWVEPGSPMVQLLAREKGLMLFGGYYPIKYDPAASQRAEQFADAEDAKRQMQSAYTSSTTRRSFTKARAEEVRNRPLLYNLSGLYSGVTDVIHDLAWHEWLIDVNRLMRSDQIDSAIRSHYGADVKAQFKSWIADIAAGSKPASDALEMALGKLRQSVSVAGLGFNVMSAAMQPLGFTQSIVRIGAGWVGRGIADYIANPKAASRFVNERSDFMTNRHRTRFRELNEVRNQVQGQARFKSVIDQYAYFMMLRVQQMVDIPTWIGAYNKALSEGNSEERASALADQAVIDSQGGGEIKDQSSIERGNPATKLFTVFYSFMNTAFNLGAGRAMTERSKARLAVDMLLLYSVPAVLGAALKDALTPGGGDDDEETLVRKMAAEQLSYLMGMMVVVREMSYAAKIITGAEGARDYQGPAGLRMLTDAGAFLKQAAQGEFDDSFRKATINLVGDMFGLPSAQINRTITGIEALSEGETDNPAAIVFGFQR